MGKHGKTSKLYLYLQKSVIKDGTMNLNYKHMKASLLDQPQIIIKKVNRDISVLQSLITLINKANALTWTLTLISKLRNLRHRKAFLTNTDPARPLIYGNRIKFIILKRKFMKKKEKEQ
jgi:hypothetical protein